MNNVIEISDLTVVYPSGGRRLFAGEKLTAVDNVTLSVEEGVSLGIAGESGSGKSTLVKAAGNLLKFGNPGVNITGKIFLNTDGKKHDILNIPGGKMKELRKHVQFIFQDPNSSLNPRLTVGEIIEEPLRYFSACGKTERKEKALKLLGMTGLEEDLYSRYPHELSGGQKQRIGIARALAPEPKVLIADEPLSSLDVSVQAQIIGLFKKLKDEFNLTLIFVSHDLSVVENLCNEVAVMYLGKILEQGKCSAVLSSPKNPYTKALISSVPVPEYRAERKERTVLQGDIPSPVNRPAGCVFCTRCPVAADLCFKTPPDLQPLEDGRLSACHFTQS